MNFSIDYASIDDPQDRHATNAQKQAVFRDTLKFSRGPGGSWISDDGNIVLDDDS